MAASFPSAINFCVVYFILVCPLSLSASQETFNLSSKCTHVSTASREAIDLSSKCPHVLTTANIKNKPRLHNGSLLVLVPWKVGFEQFVNFDPDHCSFDGFSVRVFVEAARAIPLRFDFVLHGNGSVSPAYDSMIDMVARGEADMVVADLTITSERMKKNVGFSVPYLESTLVMVTTLRYASSGALWDFLKPFSMPLWVTLLGCFVATGLALYLLENQNPDFSMTAPRCQKNEDDDDSRSHGTSTAAHDSAPGDAAPPSHPVDIVHPSSSSSDPSSLQHPGLPIYEASHKHRIMNAYWFTSLCVFTTQRELVRTHLGRFVIVMWLFMMLIIKSSYTANFASLLSAQQPYPNIQGFQKLLHNHNISVGYRVGSFMKEYINKLHLENHRLKSFTTERDYAKALVEENLSGVDAVLDELPYIQILLQSECDLTKASDDDSLPSFGGFGFAFQKNSSLIKDVSKMILALKENGSLQALKNDCGIDGRGRCTSNDESSHLSLRSFGGLFSILVGVYASCILIRLLAKGIERKVGICSPITNASACAKGGSHVGRGASLGRRSNKVNDVSLKHDIQL